MDDRKPDGSRTASRALSRPGGLRLILPGIMALFLLLGCGGDPAGPRPEAGSIPALTSADLLAPGPFSVETLHLSLEDESRPTASNGTYAGSPTRLLNTWVWYPGTQGSPPSTDGPFPLIIHSHGFLSFGSEAAYTAQHLASHGYIVACPDFPLTWMFSPGGPNVEDVVNQPEDVSFLIDTFLAFHRDPTSPFFGLVDEDRVGVMGLSLGGMTTLLVTYHPRLRDARIKAAAALAAPGSMFTRRFYRNAATPLLLVYGDIDAIVDYATNALYARERAAPRATLVTLHGATHTAFADIIAHTMEWMDNPDQLGCAALLSGLTLEVDFPALLGGAEAGVVQSETPYPCTLSPLPRSMRPSRQQDLTRLAVFAFLESRFSADPIRRRAAARFLQQTLEEENRPDATVR